MNEENDFVECTLCHRNIGSKNIQLHMDTHRIETHTREQALTQPTTVDNEDQIIIEGPIVEIGLVRCTKCHRMVGAKNIQLHIENHRLESLSRGFSTPIVTSSKDKIPQKVEGPSVLSLCEQQTETTPLPSPVEEIQQNRVKCILCGWKGSKNKLHSHIAQHQKQTKQETKIKPLFLDDAKKPNLVPCHICKKNITSAHFKAHIAHHLRKNQPQPQRTTSNRENGLSRKLNLMIDETGRVVTPELWLENQRLGDKSILPAQSKSIQISSHEFENIANAPVTIDQKVVTICPYCGAKVGKIARHLRKVHPGKSLKTEGNL